MQDQQSAAARQRPPAKRLAIVLWSRVEAAQREVFYWLWQLQSGRKAVIQRGDHRKVKIVVSSYSERRVRNLWPQARHLLRCAFVERFVISNNNPRIHLTLPPDLDPARVTVLNQETRRGPGFSWLLAASLPGDYFIGLDDDLLVYPEQIATLFQALLDDPTSPHGVAGKRERRYLVNREAVVDDLYIAYALTREHLTKYASYVAELAAVHNITPEAVEFLADDVVISRTGPGRAFIHKVGYVHLCPTALEPGTAVHLVDNFRQTRLEVTAAVEAIRSRGPNPVGQAAAS